KPYPPAIGLALRCVIPLTVVVALVAVYALWLRIDQYGLSVSRFWACVVAGAAVLYSVGYALAARHRAHWMRTVAGVNVLTALYLIAALGLALTPLLSPYRLSARSQFAMALEESAGSTVGRAYNGSSSMDYLRFSAGKYGRDRLEELSRLEGHPRAEEIRREAKAELERQYQYEPVRYDSATFLAKIVIHPAGRTLDRQLAELAGNEQRLYGPIGSGPDIAGVFVDLDRDQTEEFVLLRAGMAVLFRNEGGSWRRVEAMLFDEYQDPQTVVEAVRAGDVASEPPRWDDLKIGNRRYRLPPAARQRLIARAARTVSSRARSRACPRSTRRSRRARCRIRRCAR
ncbi:MAG TPA: hypothetical protein VE907_20375, partial [Gammaproteobacteria bacterium]|nr:hypothetical protein [Gammaproteobacteria bacterium]